MIQSMEIRFQIHYSIFLALLLFYDDKDDLLNYKSPFVYTQYYVSLLYVEKDTNDYCGSFFFNKK
jgi:hypothetical protein